MVTSALVDITWPSVSLTPSSFGRNMNPTFVLMRTAVRLCVRVCACARGRGFLGSFVRDLLTAEEAAASQTLVVSAARGTLPATGSPELLPQTFHTADDDDDHHHLQWPKHQGIHLWFHIEMTLTRAR